MFCPKCGTQLPEGAQFCANCGNQLGDAAVNQPAATNTPTSKKANKKLIIILSICLGVLLLLGGGLVAYGAVTGKFFGGGSAESGTSASEENIEQDWEAAKAAYSKKLSSYQFPNKCKFIFIDINGDNIQELYMQGPDYATGDMLWTYYDGNVSELRVPNYGLSYFEGENYFMSKQMHMGVGWDNVFSIEDGEFVSQHYGEWSEADPYRGTKDKYIFDGETMDKASYKVELNSVFDNDSAKHLSNDDPGWMTFDQLKKLLAGTQAQSHYYECEYFYIDILDQSKLSDIKIVMENQVDKNGYLTWSFSYLPNKPNYGGGSMVIVSSSKVPYEYTFIGTTSDGHYVYSSEGGGGFFSANIASITLK